MNTNDGIVEEGTFDPSEYSSELEKASENLELGTSLWFENQRIRVWEVKLDPGERGPFHTHQTNYFWTVVEGSVGLQRFADGSYVARRYQTGETKYLEHSTSNRLVHDLENIGDSTLRFVTVELLD